MASGQWRSRAVEAFQNAQRIALARKEQQEGSQHRQQVFDANQQYRQNVLGPVALRNAQSSATRAGALDLGARTRAADFLDEVQGGRLGREVIQSQASKAPLGEVPNLVGAYTPGAPQGGVTAPAAVDTFKKAQESAYKAKVREHAAKQSITQKETLKRQAAIDTFQRLNDIVVGPKKTTGLPGEEWTRRHDLQQRDMLKRALLTKVAAGDITKQKAAELLQAFDNGELSVGAAE